MRKSTETLAAENRVQEALSFIAAQTARQIANRAGVDLGLVQRVLRRMEDEGSLERQGRRYRIENAAPWCEATEDLPPLHVAHTVKLGPKGYEVSVTATVGQLGLFPAT